MATRLKLPAKDANVVVELGAERGQITEFKVKPLTLDLEEQINELMRKAAEVETNPNSKPIDYCEAEVAQLDVLLEPVKTPEGDRPPSHTIVPSEILLGQEADPNADPPVEEIPGYKTGAITRAQIRGLCSGVLEAARPT